MTCAVTKYISTDGAAIYCFGFPARKCVQQRYSGNIQLFIQRYWLTQKAQQQTYPIARLGINLDKPVLGLCPGAEFGPSKRWPEAHYAAIAKQWIADGGEVWVFGSKKNQPVANTIRQYLPDGLQTHCRLLAGNTSLTELLISWHVQQ